MTIASNVAIDISHRLEGGARVVSHAAPLVPLVSVIIVAFHDLNEVAALIDNISPYRGSDLELVIIDGGSSDGTHDLLRARNAEVDYWLSEPDKGIYDAMNKGIEAARGEYILHLNAGDRLLRTPTSELEACLQDKVDIACFRVQLDSGSMHIPRHDGSMGITNTWHHQSTFYRRIAHLGYDPTYRVFGDFDHNQRIAKVANSVRIFDSVVSYHGNPGLSASKKHFGEVYRSIRKNSGIFYVLLAFLCFKIDGLRRRLSRFILQKKRRT